jgi:hypothetical protein
MPAIQTGPKQPHQKWSTWQKVVGWLRKILNAGHAAGVWPSEKNKPKF